MVQVAATGRVEAMTTEKADVGESTNEVGCGSAATAGGDVSSAKAAEGGAPLRGCHRCGKEGHISANCTEVLCEPVQRTRAHC